MTPRAANGAAAALALALAGFAPGGRLRADESPPPPEPDLREVWVPEKALAKALRLSPRAVLLNREQYETLLRDARPPKAGDKNDPPVPAVLRSVTIRGSLEKVSESDGRAALPLTAEVRVDVLGDEWTVVPLPMPSERIASIHSDGQAAASADPQAKQLSLVVQGKGPHTFEIAFSASLEDSGGQRSLTLPATATAETRLELDVPKDIKLTTASPLSREARPGTAFDRITVTPAQPSEALSLAWSARDLDPLAPGAIFENATFIYSVDAAHLQADLALTLSSSLRDVPATFTLPVPAGAQVLAVEGAELTRWSLDGEKLTLVYPEARRRESAARITLDLPLTEAQGAGQAPVILPTPKADAAARLTGTMTVLVSPELRARAIAAGPLTTRDDASTPPGLAGPRLFGTWTFPILPTPPQLTIERLQPRLMANLDAQIALSFDGIGIQRTITLTPRDGAAFSPSLTGLDAAEQIEHVCLPDRSEVPYRRIEGGVALNVPGGLARGQAYTFTVATRLTPPDWSGLREEKPVTVSIPAAKVPGAEKTSGYVAVEFPESLRVTPTQTNGLESRDPRALAAAGLPLTGRLAWFRLDDFLLTLNAERKTSEFHASVALQALPLLNSLETEGEITLRIAEAPLRRLVVAFPQDVAAAVRWDSPLITEKSLAPDGSWTLRFQQELEGQPGLRFHLSTPLADPAAGTVENTQTEGRRFRASVIVPTLPAAKRTEATVGIEANTDTELTFPADPRLDPLDTSKLPAIGGYAPRHRVVGAFSWLGSPGQPAPALRIDGVRHKAGALVTVVADSLALDSVLSPDGPVRHQATLLVRTSADQFLDLTLPPQGRLLTLMVDGQPAKPLQVPTAATDGKSEASKGPRVRIQLPRQDGSSTVLSVIYETPGVPLDRLSSVRLDPLTLPPTLPVLSSKWQLHLPDGYSYSAFDSNLQASAPQQPVPTLAAVLGGAFRDNATESLAAVDRTIFPTYAKTAQRPSSSGKEFFRVSVETAAARPAASAATPPRDAMEEKEELKIEFPQAAFAGTPVPGGSVQELAAAKKADEKPAEPQSAVDRAATDGKSEVDHDAVREASQLATNGDFAKAREVLGKAIVNGQPEETRAAKQMLSRLDLLDLLRARDDELAFQDRYLQRLEEKEAIRASGKQPQPVDSVQLNKHLQTGHGALDLGDYNRARDEFRAALILDPHNQTALSQLEALRQRLKQYLLSARDHTRAKMGRDTDGLWETAVPSLPAKDASRQSPRTGSYEGDGLDGFAYDFYSKSVPLPVGGSNVITGGIRFGENAISNDVIDALMDDGPAGGRRSRGFSTMRTQSGLLPIDFDLPDAGQSLEFSGPYAPRELTFRVQSWERQMRQAWWLMVLGGAAFVLLGRRRLWLLGLGVPLALHFLPILAEKPDWLPVTNALNAGWLAALALTLGYRVCARAARRIAATEPRTAADLGKEAAHA